MLRENRPKRIDNEPSRKEPIRKEIVISETSELAAVFEDGRACEFLMRQGEQLVGDIILGKVESVVPAIEAAFINIGQEKNGFIHVADLPSGLNTKRKSKPPAIRSGDKLIVQIAKAPTGNKGARLTGRISVPGRYLVFVPHDNRVCISRRIVDPKERERLRRVAFNLKDPGHGLIVRTEAIGASEEELQRDIDELIDRWAEILHVAQVRHAPSLLHRDQDLMTRVLRDALSADTDRIVLDTEAGFLKANELLSGWMPEMAKNLHLHQGKDGVMAHYHISAELEAALKPTVRLPSGGSIVIESAEALTVIDVNSGKLTQSKSLQDTVLRTNLEAATEIARQLRLRDIGGVIIVDFISMDFPNDRQRVMRHFEEALRPDKSRPQITSQFSEHGLLEVARRRQGQSLLEQLTSSCPSCNGIGRIRNELYASETQGQAIPLGVVDEPEAIVEELIEEPIAGPEMLDAEREPGEAVDRLAPNPAEESELELGEASGGLGGDAFGGDMEGERRRRRRRRRRRGGAERREGFPMDTVAGSPERASGFSGPEFRPAEFGPPEFAPLEFGRIDAMGEEYGDRAGTTEVEPGERPDRRRRRHGRGGGARPGRAPMGRPGWERTETAPMGFGSLRTEGFARMPVGRGRQGEPEATPESGISSLASLGAGAAESGPPLPLEPEERKELEVRELAALEAPEPKRPPKGITPPRPILGEVERTTPYQPRELPGRPRMVIREVAPGVMEMVPSEPAPAATQELQQDLEPVATGTEETPARTPAPATSRVTRGRRVASKAKATAAGSASKRPAGRRGAKGDGATAGASAEQLPLDQEALGAAVASEGPALSPEPEPASEAPKPRSAGTGRTKAGSRAKKAT